MDEIERLVTKLEGLNGDIAAIKQIVDAQEQAGYIIGVTQTADGYQFTMSNGSVINVRDGKDGKDGINGTDGTNGTNGTNGQDGITPQLRINATTQMWEVSYDSGISWTSLGVKAQGEKGDDGDAFFQSVVVGETEVTFTLADGTTTFKPMPYLLLLLALLLTASWQETAT